MTASCNWAIAKLPGLNEEHRQLLAAHQITTTHQLLLATQTKQQQHTFAAQLKIHPHHIAKWIALADLARLKSVGIEYCGLLLHCGIISVGQLAQTPFPRLHGSITKLHVANMRRRDLVPNIGLVQQWVREAQNLSQ